MAATVKRKQTTTERGLGWRHRQEVQRLRENHRDGSACDWCGRPRWLDRTSNYDYDPNSTNPASGQLQGDHESMSRSEAQRRGLPIPLPDRLLHAQCNRERGDGANDHLAANATSKTPTATNLDMPWPW